MDRCIHSYLVNNKLRTNFVSLAVIFTIFLFTQNSPVIAGEAAWEITSNYSSSVVTPIIIYAETPMSYDASISASGSIKIKSPTNVTSTVNISSINSSGFSHIFALKEVGKYQIEETYTLTVSSLAMGTTERFTRKDTWFHDNTQKSPALFRLDDMYVDNYIYDVNPKDTLSVESVTPSLLRPGESGEIIILIIRDILPFETVSVSINLTGIWHKFSSLTVLEDNEPPAILHGHTTPVNAGSKIVAKITDNVGVESAYMYFKDVFSSEFVQKEMIPTGKTDEYYANIPINANEGYSKYYFRAIDLTGNETIFPPNAYDVFVDALDFGDVDGNRILNDNDALLVLKNTLGIVNLTANQKLLGDVSGDGNISSYDSGLIQQRAAGIINTFPIQQAGFSSVGSSNASSAVDVEMPDLLGLPGSNFTVPINISNTGGLGITGTDIVINYDPNILTAKNIVLADTMASGWLIAFKVTSGQIAIAMANEFPLNGAGQMAKIGFNVPTNANAGGVSPFTISKISLNEDKISADKTNGSFEVMGQNKISLYKGWNIFSYCLEIEDNSIPAALSSINGRWKSIWAYESNPGWQKYIYGGPNSVNILQNILPGKGYLIYMDSNATLTITGKALSDKTISLKPGPNLVGYNSLISHPPEDALVSMPDGTSIWTYKNGNWFSYKVGDPDFRNNLVQLVPGVGYYIYVAQSINWVIP